MRSTLRRLAIVVIGVACARAQIPGLPSGSKSASAGGTTSAGNPSIPSATSTPAPSATTDSGPRRTIFISGTVIMGDGSPLPGGVDILAICGAQQRIVAHASPGGDFSFEWNNAGSVLEDVEDTQRMPGGNRSINPMASCDLAAKVSGYTSGKVSLSDRSMSDTIDVGSVVLHRITGNEGRTVSVLALKAPRAAVKDFDKGTEQARAHKLPEAAASFQRAVAVYPQYADAWLSLGKVEWDMGAANDAHTDFVKAMDLDVKMAGPWQELGYMASDQSKWEDAARYLDQAVRLDPMDSAMAWYFSAMANYNLGHFDVAERSVRAEIKLDHDQNPHAEFLLGLVLIARKDLPGAAGALRKYIRTWPNSDYVDSAKRQLSRIESQISKSTPQ